MQGFIVPSRGRFTVQVWHGWQGLPAKSHLRNARIAINWLWLFWWNPRAFFDVRIMQKNYCPWVYCKRDRCFLLLTNLWFCFRPSFSPYVVKMSDYVAAEKAGQQDGECWRYYKDCPQSLFITSERNKYS